MTDKPAAAGSGEPKSEHEYVNGVCLHCRQFESEATPPASQPTVTLGKSDPYPPVVLTRTQYSNLIGDLLLAKDRIKKSQKNLALETVDRMLALLRAAETRKP